MKILLLLLFLDSTNVLCC